MQKRFFFMMMLLVTSLTVVAQYTTSGLSGKVVYQDNNEPVIGATIVSVHEPSGTRYTAISNVNGLFSIQGMRTGGPYSVTVSYIGCQTKTMTDLKLLLGETTDIHVALSEASAGLQEVVVTGRALPMSHRRKL